MKQAGLPAPFRDYASILACPITGEPLRETADGFVNAARTRHYPIENGIPVDRSRIISHLMPFNGAWPYGVVPTDDPNKLIGMWTEELNRQAATIGYLNDFRVLAISAIVFIPLLFFMRRQASFARPSRR